MHTVLILSPDPETNRLAQLAFDLDGWNVLAGRDASAGVADVVLMDIPSRDQVADVTEAEPQGAAAARSIVILPRGMDAGQARRSIGERARFIRRPFDILSVVRAARELTGEESKGRAPRPRRARKAVKKPPKKKRPKK